MELSFQEALAIRTFFAMTAEDDPLYIKFTQFLAKDAELSEDEWSIILGKKHA